MLRGSGRPAAPHRKHATRDPRGQRRRVAPLDAEGVPRLFAAGHSLGEYSAHVAAGTLSFADALRTVRRRGRYMQEAVPVGEGAMAAILGLDADGVATACEEAAQSAGARRDAGQPQCSRAGGDCRACRCGGARRRD